MNVQVAAAPPTQMPGRRFFLGAAALWVGLLGTGCSFGDDPVTVAREGEADPTEYGAEADPTEYEVSELRCEPNPDDDQRIDVRLVLTNTGNDDRLFEIELQLETIDGEWDPRSREIPDQYLSPGESLIHETWTVIGERTELDAECRVVIINSPLEVFDD